MKRVWGCWFLRHKKQEIFSRVLSDGQCTGLNCLSHHMVGRHESLTLVLPFLDLYVQQTHMVEVFYLIIYSYLSYLAAPLDFSPLFSTQ